MVINFSVKMREVLKILEEKRMTAEKGELLASMTKFEKYVHGIPEKIIGTNGNKAGIEVKEGKRKFRRHNNYYNY